MKQPRRKVPGILARTPEVSELDFNDDAAPPRSGDPISPEILRSELSRRRARRVGLTGAAVGEDFTADDLAPETLIDTDDPDSTVHRKLGPADTTLSRLDEGELFAEEPEEAPPISTPRQRHGTGEE